MLFRLANKICDNSFEEKCTTSYLVCTSVVYFDTCRMSTYHFTLITKNNKQSEVYIKVPIALPDTQK